MSITKINELDSCKAEVFFSYSKDKISKIVDNVAKDIGKDKNYKIKGSRPGHASVEAVKCYAKKVVLEMAKQKVVNEAFQDILYEQKWKPFTNPQVTDESFDYNNFSAKFTVGYLPTFELKAYKELELNEPINVPTKEAIYEKMVEGICNNFSENVPFTEDDFILQGDTAVVNYVGTIDGKEFIDNRAEGVMIEVGKGSALPGFEENIIGMRAGERREIEVTFDDKFEKDYLRGKTVKFATELVSAARKSPVNFDDEVAKKTGYENLDKLKEYIDKQADEYKGNARLAALRVDAVNKLLELNEVPIPEWMVTETAHSSIQMQGADFTALPKNQQEYMIDQARKNIKTAFIIDKIKELEADTVLAEREAVQILQQNFNKFSPEIQKEIAEGKNPMLVNKVISDIQNENVIRWVVEHAKVSVKMENVEIKEGQ